MLGTESGGLSSSGRYISARSLTGKRCSTDCQSRSAAEWSPSTMRNGLPNVMTLRTISG